VERIDEVPAAGLTTQSRSGWGRRCGLWAANHAHQPASMAEGGSLGSGVAPARRASHARHPGGDGAPPGWPLRAACEELADDPGSPDESAARRRDKNATSGAPRGEHSSQLVCADCVNLSAVARDASRLTSVARRADRKVRHKVRLPALRSPRFLLGEIKRDGGRRRKKSKPPGGGALANCEGQHSRCRLRESGDP